MKLLKTTAIALTLALLLGACGTKQPATKKKAAKTDDGMIHIALSDSKITVDGKDPGSDTTAAVYVANDIVYYEAGKDFTYGEGSEEDAHTPEEAAAHQVVHITKPGTYSLSGKLSKGQVAVDLGEDAKKDPTAVVTLYLNGVDITCEVAPAVIFYNVYECGSDDTETATKDVDTSAAGANVIIADDTINTVNGSYVARIYDPETVELSEDGTEVADAKKLHKYDGAFYSKRTMNISGNTGILNIKAANEGLDSELHLTINGGNIHIESGNDGINTNEDEVSVTTVNGGALTIQVTGETGEGDGIDSNGWLVINGGTVIAQACAKSGDAGIDSDMGIHINGGTVIATGNMLDRISESQQTYAVFNFMQNQQGGETVRLKDADGNALLEYTPENSYSYLIFSSPDLQEATYTLWSDDTQLSGTTGLYSMGPGGMERPGGEMPEGQHPELPEGELPNGERPQMPEGQPSQMPEGERPELPEGEMPQGERPQNPEGGNNINTQELSSDFAINAGGNQFAVMALSSEL